MLDVLNNRTEHCGLSGYLALALPKQYDTFGNAGTTSGFLELWYESLSTLVMIILMAIIGFRGMVNNYDNRTSEQLILTYIVWSILDTFHSVVVIDAVYDGLILHHGDLESISKPSWYDSAKSWVWRKSEIQVVQQGRCSKCWLYKIFALVDSERFVRSKMHPLSAVSVRIKSTA